MALERYRAFIDDWDAFQEALLRPEPRTLRVRTGRISVDEVAARLAEQGFETRPFPGLPDFLEVTHQPFPVSESLEHWLGLFYIQQAATGVAAPILDPHPGDRVLDMCAAPGGKTTHLADLMEDRGAVVAADVNEKRLRALLGNVYRTAHTNILTVASDGRLFPSGATFDRILADVPCSGEGMVRKKGGRVGRTSQKALDRMTRSQEKLLRRAVDLLRPGGEVLYVTCTFSPDENESVVSRVLADTDLEVLPIDLGLPHARGLTEFEDEVFDPRMADACRIYPHHFDSGGLFLCHLRKPGEGAVEGWGPVPALFPSGGDAAPPADEEAEAKAEIAAGETYLRDVYGVPEETLADVGWIVRGENIWLHTLDAWPAQHWEAIHGWRVLSVGVRALSRDGRGQRPTTDLIRWLDGPVGDRTLRLDPEQWKQALSGMDLPLESLPVGDGRTAADLEDGFVTLCLGDRGVGRGVVRRGRLLPELPKARAGWLLKVLDRTFA
jgi:NOL1/NOP2/sun family putative RNA methylase